MGGRPPGKAPPLSSQEWGAGQQFLDPRASCAVAGAPPRGHLGSLQRGQRGGVRGAGKEAAAHRGSACGVARPAV
eukprot:15479788-Alexandrium_andersonii.AAC.1